MSVVLVTPDNFETIRRTVGHLNAQTVRDRLELVLVTPAPDQLNIDESAVSSFACVKIVPLETLGTIARNDVAGVRAASAPIIVLAEDHCFPDPRWAESLIAAHEGPYAAVGPVVRNANPATMISWADLIIAYGDWMEPLQPGTTHHIPGHNSSYKREILFSFGDRLEELMEHETVLHWELLAQGHQLYIEPKAITYHMNYAIPSAFVRPHILSGRSFGASRSMHWSLVKRLAFAGGAWLIPFVRLRRMMPKIRQNEEMRKIQGRLLPILFTGLVVRSFGEMLGYLFGAGDARDHLPEYEFHRERMVPPSDQDVMSHPATPAS
jgi:hypothetical protein